MTLIRFLLSNPVLTFCVFLAFRIVNSFLVQTFFQPDEYFQSLEPAWLWAFGPGSGAWITWEWKEQLRSSFLPLLFASGYKTVDHVLALLGTDQISRSMVVATVPRLIQSVSAATTDLYTWRLAEKVYGRAHPSSRVTLGLTFLSPWQWFCSTRTFSNCLETTLTIVALDSFPYNWFNGSSDVDDKKRNPTGLDFSLLCAAAACILRPTNILIWLGISACVVRCCGFSGQTRIFLTRAITCGTVILSVSLSMDRAFYDMWTFPPLRFLYFNLLQSLAGFYGRNRPDYYLTEGLPLLLMTAIPFAIAGLWQGLYSRSTKRYNGELTGLSIPLVLSTASLVSIISLSLISHKEVRFIYPLLPMLHILAAEPLAHFLAFSSHRVRRWRLFLLCLGATVNIGIAMYVSLIHQRGVIDVMHYLRHRQEARMMNNTDNEGLLTNEAGVSVGFLMPCHSTPWRTHLKYSEIKAWALTCEPPINKTQEERKAYLDEADIFYDDPVAWVKANMEDTSSISGQLEPLSRPQNGQRLWPEYLVFFEQLVPTLERLLQGTRYTECRRFFNTHWHDDWRREGDVVVWCMRDWDTTSFE